MRRIERLAAKIGMAAAELERVLFHARKEGLTNREAWDHLELAIIKVLTTRKEKR